MEKFFVVVSGLPGSGKSTLGQQLAQALHLPLLDKDNILELLFESAGIADRRALSRKSDLILQAEAERSDGAILVSHWRLSGMPADSGTPTGWISTLPHRIVHVHCECPVELCAERFVQRRRHPGHLDAARSPSEILSSIREVLAPSWQVGDLPHNRRSMAYMPTWRRSPSCGGPFQHAPSIAVDTAQPVDLDAVLHRLHEALAREIKSKP